MKGLKLSYEGNVAVLEMIDGKNEFTHDFLDELNQALDTIESNPSVVALVTYGGQGRHYSNGINLAQVGSEGFQRGLTFSKKFCDFMARLVTFPVPTLAAINGHAFAGGCVLALCHDFRVMNSQQGWMCLPEVKINLMFTRTLMEIVKSKIPVGMAQRDMLVMGRRLTAPEAQSLGVVDQVCQGDRVLGEALTFARQLVSGGEYSRKAMGDMKSDLYRNVLDTLGDRKYNFMTDDIVKSAL